MEELDTVFNIALISFLHGDFGRMGIALQKELNGDNGLSAIARWESKVTQGRWSGSPRINIIWRNAASANYVYGVSAQDARPNRPEYELSGGLRSIISYELSYALIPKWELFGGLEYAWYSSEITESPIVDEEETFGLWMGIRKDL